MSNINDESFATLGAEDVGFILQQRMDYTVFLEQTTAAPIAFEDRSGLDLWISRHKVSAFRDLAPDALSVTLDIPNCGPLQQLWVAKTCKKYRFWMKTIAKDEFNEENFNGVDADHILARTVLSHIPDAWIAVFPVEQRSNRGFGRIERALPRARQGFERYDLTPLAAIKIFNARLPRTESEKEHMLKDFDNHIMGTRPAVSYFKKKMREELDRYFAR